MTLSLILHEANRFYLDAYDVMGPVILLLISIIGVRLLVYWNSFLFHWRRYRQRVPISTPEYLALENSDFYSKFLSVELVTESQEQKAFLESTRRTGLPAADAHLRRCCSWSPTRRDSAAPPTSRATARICRSHKQPRKWGFPDRDLSRPGETADR
jgi:hypothetical protein